MPFIFFFLFYPPVPLKSHWSVSITDRIARRKVSTGHKLGSDVVIPPRWRYWKKRGTKKGLSGSLHEKCPYKYILLLFNFFSREGSCTLLPFLWALTHSIDNSAANEVADYQTIRSPSRPSYQLDICIRIMMDGATVVQSSLFFLFSFWFLAVAVLVSNLAWNLLSEKGIKRK